MAQQPAHWPHEDQDDDPPVGLSIRPLRQLPDLPAPAPMLPAGAPNASWERGRSLGTPGASAMAYYQQARAGEWTRFARSLSWRLAAVAAAGALAGTLAYSGGPRLAGPAAALAAGLVGWRLRFRISAETAAWRRGARGERRTARALRHLVRQSWTVLHDVAIPRSQANGDHLLIGPPGVFLVDSKAWHGTITQAINGSAWHNGHPLDQAIATVRWEAEQLAAALGAPVLPLLCVHDTRIPWGEIRQRPGAHPRQAADPAAVTAGPHGPGRGDAAGRAHPPPTPPRHLSQASFAGHCPWGGQSAPGASPPGQPVVFSHGWPLNADAWDDQAMLVASSGYWPSPTTAAAMAARGNPWLATTWTPMPTISPSSSKLSTCAR